MLTIETIYAGETAQLEFKREPSADARKWVKTAIAFANGRGGSIVFGIDDKTRRLVGVDPNRAAGMADSVANLASDLAVPSLPIQIFIQTLDEKTIIVAKVEGGANTPYHFKGQEPPDGVFVRVGATTRPAEHEQVRELMLDGANRTYDEVVESGMEPASDEEIKFLSEAIQARSRDANRPIGTAQLVGLHLLRREGETLLPSVAFRLFTRGDLLFARIQCAVFRGLDKVDFLRRLELEGPLHEQVERAAEFVEQAMPPGARIRGMRREDVYELPMPAVRELIYNAAMHRNYLSSSFIQVSVFPDRLEVFSPGGLYKRMTREEMLSGVSCLRNPVIADVFRRMGFVERWGSGMRRVFDLCRENGLRPPRVETNDNWVRVTLLRPSMSEFAERIHGKGPVQVHREWIEPTEQIPAQKRFSANEDGLRFGYDSPALSAPVKEATLARILAFVRASPGANRLAIAAAVGISPRTATRALGRLMAEDRVEHRGSDKFGGFHVK